MKARQIARMGPLAAAALAGCGIKAETYDPATGALTAKLRMPGNMNIVQARDAASSRGGMGGVVTGDSGGGWESAAVEGSGARIQVGGIVLEGTVDNSTAVGRHWQGSGIWARTIGFMYGLNQTFGFFKARDREAGMTDRLRSDNETAESVTNTRTAADAAAKREAIRSRQP